MAMTKEQRGRVRYGNADDNTPEDKEENTKVASMQRGVAPSTEMDPIPKGGPRGGLVIKDASHLNRLIRNAEGDADLRKIKKALERQGMDSSVIAE